MCILKVMEAFFANLWHTSFLGVLRGAESKSAVCQAEKWLLMPQNREIQDGHQCRGYNLQMCISFLLNMVESRIKHAFLCFQTRGIHFCTQFGDKICLNPRWPPWQGELY